ncbi:hypothetical protein [Rhodococcus pyridinivorans]|uniref:hypothetical protein n=1 Tax=Rhodococcus pyridinivorans TaxID=103816 RepID=UPI0011141B86|nr:hypothetical protein [Rhodococcus pyridinivorans]
MSTRDFDQRYNAHLIASLAASVGIMLGSIGPWASFMAFTKNGLEGDGMITLILGVLSAVAMFTLFSRGVGRRDRCSVGRTRRECDLPGYRDLRHHGRLVAHCRVLRRDYRRPDRLGIVVGGDLVGNPVPDVDDRREETPQSRWHPSRERGSQLKGEAHNPDGRPAGL